MVYGIRNDELYHFGIKGMKWGVRRYRNEDGTLTELGKKRLDESRRKPLSQKEIGFYTDEELDTVVARANKEKSYYDSISNLQKAQGTKIGKEVVNHILSTSIKDVGTQVAKYEIGKLVNSILDANVVNLNVKDNNGQQNQQQNQQQNNSGKKKRKKKK